MEAQIRQRSLLGATAERPCFFFRLAEIFLDSLRQVPQSSAARLGSGAPRGKIEEWKQLRALVRQSQTLQDNEDHIRKRRAAKTDRVASALDVDIAAVIVTRVDSQ